MVPTLRPSASTCRRQGFAADAAPVTMDAMSGGETRIDPVLLAQAAAEAGNTVVTSAPAVIAAPTTAGTSPIDVALAGAAIALPAVTGPHDVADNAAALKQLEALSESPPQLVAQDERNAQAITEAGGQVPDGRHFPMPVVGPPNTGVMHA